MIFEAMLRYRHYTAGESSVSKYLHIRADRHYVTIVQAFKVVITVPVPCCETKGKGWQCVTDTPRRE